MHHLSIDLETYSSVPIAKAGAQKYISSPDFEILLFAYSLDGAPVEIVDLATGEQLPPWLVNSLTSPEYIKHAYNAPFEWGCLSKFVGYLPPEQWRCTMFHGLYCGYTAGLDATGRALGLEEDKRKLNTGKALIRYFCVPCAPTKANGGRTRNYPQHDPAKWQLFKEYCRQDVVTEMEIERRLSAFPVPDFVQKQWETDLIINARGVAVDMDFVSGALYLGSTVRKNLMQEATDLSKLDNPNSVGQLTQWLQEEMGEELTDLRKDTVSRLLNKDGNSPQGFQSSLWTAIATRGRAPYKQVITHGFVVGQDRKKISKSADGKPQTSDMYVGKWGADIVRFWISSVDYQNDIPISDDILSHISNAYRGVRNTIMYQLGNLYDFDRAKDAVAPEKLDALDKWALYKTAQFVDEAQKAYDAYEFHKVYKLIDNFCGVTLSRVYHDILKDRLYTYAAHSAERRSSQTAIDIISDALIKVAAPILTFTADEAYSFKNGAEYSEDSVHLQDWPEIGAEYRDEVAYERVERVLSLREKVNEELEKLRQNKTIGKSLEAEIEIMVGATSPEAEALRELSGNLPEIFIVSAVRVVEGNFETPAVRAAKVEGRRCARCWRVMPDLPEDGICPRCKKAMSEHI